ncbi:MULTISPECIES: hypothetical protein [unclassified Nodosilinea]|uniref:Uncharacterized protein n=1 Tax=Leptolyngbya subtilissima DQ-A4 TaxID=2933933 RepID=A0ABV0K6P3_9CYAN|nr:MULTISPECIES: hypothetical protein [unclassified Nodosilinea]MBD2106384.1 hypothetical protein [Nodosilinea sp. FACHB-13]MBD2113985.1 hypothetical protein [Nodosilinea sp. FACHB-141]
MSLIQEIFLETDWEEVEQAQAACDLRAAQLKAEGHTCTCTTLYRITDGRRVFLLEAQHPDSLEPENKPSRRRLPARRSAPRG